MVGTGARDLMEAESIGLGDSLKERAKVGI